MNINLCYRKIISTWWFLKIFYGTYFIVCGIDKFFNIFVDWPKYVHPGIINFIKIDIYTFMFISGIVQIITGGLILTFWTRIGTFFATIEFFAIALNLIFLGTFINTQEHVLVAGPFFGIGLNYIVMTIGIVTLYRFDCIVRLFDEKEPAS